MKFEFEVVTAQGHVLRAIDKAHHGALNLSKLVPNGPAVPVLHQVGPLKGTPVVQPGLGVLMDFPPFMGLKGGDKIIVEIKKKV